VNEPFDPLMVTAEPVEVLPSPQSMLAEKSLALSLRLLSLKVATCVPEAIGVPSVAFGLAPATGARPISAVVSAVALAKFWPSAGSSEISTEIVSWPLCA
jgi:hypothetical protein